MRDFADLSPFGLSSPFPRPLTPHALAYDPVALFDPSDLSTLYQDAAGVVPVTADGDPVRRVLDKSGNGNHLVAR
ncbi:hypothetical protein [Tritonibacter horizontis]|uniref:Uncharacterized protein n=1 Tax=Tritonibacter horizontis TaxID=1768241 RepID=A0A132BZU4_9RHOB|nr:hypothetical protein [Tritonibacter horizontis]KUP93875.1 hypothetical protein TRIHO_13670 [Tritonibacter horizontis]